MVFGTSAGYHRHRDGRPEDEVLRTRTGRDSPGGLRFHRGGRSDAGAARVRRDPSTAGVRRGGQRYPGVLAGVPLDGHADSAGTDRKIKPSTPASASWIRPPAACSISSRSRCSKPVVDIGVFRFPSGMPADHEPGRRHWRCSRPPPPRWNSKRLPSNAWPISNAALCECLDTASHRVDAWATSLATARLAQVRADNPTGLRTGAYGWVADLEPLSPGRRPERDGYLVTPSMQHATTAAVLRAGCLAHSDPSRSRSTSLRAGCVRRCARSRASNRASHWITCWATDSSVRCTTVRWTT